MIYGLAAALGFGLSDLGAAIVARRLGSLVAVAVSQAAGFLALGLLFVVVRPPFEVAPGDALLLTLNGVMAAGGFLTFYRALELGPITLVDPIATAYPVVTVLLSVILLKESISGLVLWAVVFTLVGVLLTSTDFRSLTISVGEARSGVPLALVAMGLFGGGTFILGESSQKVGWFAALIVARAVLTAVLLIALIARRRVVGPIRLRGMPAAAIVGLVSVIGDGMYARGSELGLVSIVAAVSATSTLIVVAGGIILFHERPVANQALGIALVVAGLVLLGVTT